MRNARVLLALVAASHLFIPLFTLAELELLRHDLAAKSTAMSAADLDQQAATAVTIAVVVHVPLLLLTGFLAFAISTGHPWTLRPATVSQLFGIAFSSLSTPPFDVLRPLIPVLIALGVAIIALLWVPRSSRAFFASHPRSRATRLDLGAEGHSAVKRELSDQQVGRNGS